MDKFRLDGKVALITGASYGIGFAIATAMAEAGATIVFNDIKQELVDKGLAAYKEAGIPAHGYVCEKLCSLMIYVVELRTLWEAPFPRQMDLGLVRKLTE